MEGLIQRRICLYYVQIIMHYLDYGVIPADPNDMKIRHINPGAEENNFKLTYSPRIDIKNIQYHFENIFKGSSVK
jgi:saccharopine dehydrogenase-like NADP-dependent oxidoreductase